MPGPVFPGKNMPQKRKEKSLFSVAPQGISGIFRKKARLAPFFGKKPAEENAPPAGSPSQKALASPHALPPGNDAPRRISEGHPDRCSRKAPLPHASGLVQGNPARVVRLRIPPPARPPGDCGQPPCFSRPGRSGAFPKMPHGAAAQLLPPKKQAFARPSAARFPGRAALFRERCCVESPPRKSGLSALLSGRGTPFPPLDGAECRETQKKRYFQLTLVFNFTNTALSLPREPRGAHARLPAGLPRHCRHQGKERLPESLP